MTGAPAHVEERPQADSPTPRSVERTAVRVGLVLLLAGAGAYLVYLTRGTSFWQDEWDFILFRRGGDVDTFLEPHNDHLSLVPVAVYKLLFATFGLEDSAPYRIVVIALHLVVAALVFVYASRRVTDVLALVAAALVLFVGPAWQNIIWPFQIGWLASLAAGLGMLLALDRRTQAADLAACGLLALSLASSGLGLPLAIGLVVELGLGRELRRRIWIVAAPMLLYGLWYLGYGGSNRAGASLAETPGFAAEAFAAALAALFGVAGNTVADGSQSLDWGRPLAALAAALLVTVVVRAGRLSPRLGMLIAAGLSFWVLTALSRGAFAEPWESRYMYVGALVIVLAGVEVARGVQIPRPVVAVLAAVACAVVIANLEAFRQGADLLRANGGASRARAAALDIVRPVVDRGYLFVRYGDIQYPAGAYYDAVDQFGSFGGTPEQLSAEREGARQHADGVMADALRLRLESASAPVPLGPAPAVVAASGGEARAEGSCIAFRPESTRSPRATGALEVTLPPAGLRLAAGEGSSTEVAVRRFAATFQPPLGRVREGALAVLRALADRAAKPWRVRLSSGGPVTACGLRPR